MTNNLTKKEILVMLKNGRITPEEALKLYKEMEQVQYQKAETVFYTSRWKEKELEHQVEFPAGNIMLFCTDANTFKQLKKNLEPKGLKPIGVLPGEAYKELAADMYRVNPACGEDYEKLVKTLVDSNMLPLKIVHMWSMDDKDENLTEYVDKSIFSVFNLTRAYMKNKVNDNIKLIYANKTLAKVRLPQHEAMDGFFRSLHSENTRYMFKMVYFSQNFVMDVILKELSEESFDSFEIKYIDGMRFIKVREEKEYDANMSVFLPFKEKGVYLVTGGAKGLGLIFSEYLARKYKAKLVITGRSELDEQIELRLTELKSLGSEAVYIKADVSDKMEVEELVKKAKKHFKNINGIIHSAGVTRDSFIFKKTREEIEQVLAPKVFGTVNLDNALKDEKLDFFVMFSSINSITGNAGQCDYAYANRFLDSFSRLREVLVKDKKRFGKTVSINWSPWKEGGMVIHEEDKEIFMQKTGYIPLTREAGIRIFEAALSMDASRCIAAYGIKDRLKAHITGFAEGKLKSVAVSTDIDKKFMLEKTEAFLKDIFADLLRIPVKRIDTTVSFQEYGIDSVMVNRFNYEIEQKTVQLPKTILFECLNISELAEYMINNHRSDLLELFDAGSPADHTNDTKPQVEMQSYKQPVDTVCLNGKNMPKGSKCQDFDDRIAIIGISGRYPQANDCDELWQNISYGRDSITEIPLERWDYKKYYNPDQEKSKQGSTYCKWGGFIDGADSFDPAFFNISPREAEVMDPQERLFVETVWNALEDAGYSLKSIRENSKRDRQSDVGVFVGVTTNTYMLWGPSQLDKGSADLPQSYPWSVANRVSFLFNFNGPSIPVDTACSSSLTAIHLACESLKRGECSVAVAGGVNLYLHPIKYIMLSQMNMLSPTGRCHSFGEKADGFVPGEGVGAIILKPLSNAIKDNDNIYAIIRGSAINHGGIANGYTVPNPAAQANVIRDALNNSNINARTVSYIEAHGTGTSLGDPIEVAGLTKAFGEHTRDTNYCAIGSLKSNIGHLEAAAGIAAVTKVLLQMKHKKLVPSLHAEKLNPRIDFEASPLYIQKELSDWKQPVVYEDGVGKTYPRRAGISSFGAGGANAHVILEEFENTLAYGSMDSSQERVIVLSAKNTGCLKEYARKMCTYLERVVSQNVQSDSDGHQSTDKHGINLAHFAYTLQVGRDALDERLAFTASSLEEVIDAFKAFYTGSTSNRKFYRGNFKDNKENGTIPDCDDSFLKSAMSSGDLGSFARLWAEGADINWDVLYEEQKPCRISLPTYPFQKKKYWIGSFDSQEGIEKAEHHRNPMQPASMPKGAANEGAYGLDFESELNRFASSYHGDEVKMDIMDGSIAVIAMQDRKNSNMLTGNLYHGLVSKFYEIQNNSNIKAVVLTGTDKIFCMGGTQDNLSGIANLEGKCSDGSFIYKGLLSCKVPVIAAMQGHAMGGGLIFGLFADIVIMSNESVYSANFTRYGFTPGVGATYVLKDKLGSNLAMEMMFTAKEYRGDELKERGASFMFRDRQEVVEEALAIARMLARKPLNTLKVLKHELSGRVLALLPDILEREVGMHDTVFSHPDVEEVKQKIEYYFNAPAAQQKQHEPSGEVIPAKNNLKLVLKDKTKNHGSEKSNQPEGGVDESQKAQPVYPAGNTDVKAQVTGIINRILRIHVNEINLKLSVKELGMDSISGVEFIRDINKTFGLNLEAVILYDFPNILGIINHISGELKSKGAKDDGQGLKPVSLQKNHDAHTELPKGKITLKPNEPWDTGKVQLGLKPSKDEKANAVGKTISLKKPQAPANKDKQADGDTEEFVKGTVLNIISNILHIRQDEINLKLSVKELGMDSISGVELIRDINRTFGLNLEAVMLYDFANIKALIKFVLDEVEQKGPVTAAGMNGTAPVEENQEDEDEDRIMELLRKLKDDNADIDDVDQRLEDML